MKLSVDSIEFTATPDIDQEQLQGLVESIKEVGLSHPIIVRPANTLGKHPLASGEKRLLAHKLLGLPEIEAEVRDCSEVEGETLRLHENLKRFNLPWWDQVTLTEKLHSLRQQEHGIATRGRPTIEEKKEPEKKGWSLRDTAEELGVGVGPLSEDLSLARALRNDPGLKKVKDKKTAIRLVRNATARFEAERASTLPSAFTANEVYFGDSATILQSFPPTCIDHCITDPPWIKFFDPALTIDDRTLPVFKELYRVLKYGSFLYVFCGLDDYAYYAGITKPDANNPNESIHERGKLEEIGFSVSNTPIIWHKEKSLSRRGVRAWEYDRDFEFIIVAVKGSPTLVTSRRLAGVKSFPIVPTPHMIHPNEKPVDIMEDIITDCSYEGNIIIDPFGGSGATAVAAKKNKRKYIVCERDHKFYTNICKRLEGK